MSGSTCQKKVICCSQIQGGGTAIDQTYEGIFETDPESADDGELYSMLEEFADAEIDLQRKHLKALGQWIEKRRKK